MSDLPQTSSPSEGGASAVSAFERSSSAISGGKAPQYLYHSTKQRSVSVELQYETTDGRIVSVTESSSQHPSQKLKTTKFDDMKFVGEEKKFLGAVRTSDLPKRMMGVRRFDDENRQSTPYEPEHLRSLLLEAEEAARKAQDQEASQEASQPSHSEGDLPKIENLEL